MRKIVKNEKDDEVLEEYTCAEVFCGNNTDKTDTGYNCCG